MDMRKTLRALALVLLVGAGAAAAVDDSMAVRAANVRRQVEDGVRAELKRFGTTNAVSGTVTFAGADFFFLQRGDESVKVHVSGASVPSAGDAVRAVGGPSLEGGRVVFAAKSWRKTGGGVLPAPRVVGAADLTFAAQEPSEVAQDAHGRRVTLEGRAVGLTESGFALDVESLPVTVVAEDYPGFIASSGSTHPRVRVTGVVETVLDQSVLFGRGLYVMGVKLHLASANDVELEPDLVYLTNVGDRRIRFAVAAAFVALALLLLVLVVLSVRQARRRLRTRTLMAERKRMADDLHDTIEQHLVGAGMLLQLNRVKETLDILNRAKREMRDIVWGLKNDDMMRLTPAEMVRAYAKGETQKGLCRVEAHVPGLPAHLDAAQMRDLSLILREAVGNAVKHGGAKKVAISCDAKADGGWVLRLGNDGVPFDPAKAPGADEGHFGIEGMKARARRLHAELTFEPKGERTIMVLETR